MNSTKNLDKKITRRDAIKIGSLTTAVVAATAIVSPKETLAQTLNKSVEGSSAKRHATIDDIYKIDPNMRRFDQANTAFCKSVLNDFGIKPLNPDDNPQLKNAFMNVVFSSDGFNPISGLENPHLKEQKPGHTDLDLALDTGALGMENFTSSAFARIMANESGTAISLPDGTLMPLSLYKQDVPLPGQFKKFPKKYKFETTDDAAYAIKKAAKLYGADLVGIAPFEERWVYNTEAYIPFDVNGQPIKEEVNIFRKVEFDFEPKSVIVLGFEMDYESYKTQPSAIGAAATSMGYSKMMETSVRLAFMLRRLGYNTVHAGNAVGVSVPLAIQAGLGESSRMGLLITEEFGPRVRLAKVYTDLDITTDAPKTFGVKQFCEICRKCADACPSKAISKAVKTTDPENKPMNDCNGKGIDKWYNDHQKCLSFWGENWGECAVCISVCPYNKIDMWHHEAARSITKIPGLRNLARSFDEIFGYGQAGSEKLMKSYWKRRI
ncbi:reductive dehalogenase [Mariniphaga anaerophila]|uniref:Reductive dehalogenase n=1 Tax=Mariniphaga anaerophila TaxID=1484053 RepID=A0A1M4VS17_9BACT|nr:reductive dehalogenase [Mariniphaga anaerophila]SHE71640.1 reductive dehalogenase [Mariniphaga anaerophila]